ncbi:MAG: cyclophilin-like fold protein [Methanothrix sp.]|uniref:cyclophilin-like fold protein n=1 Tax=Methanothrix sp. TaxID=90426 RepID=UPI0025EC3319|nr:cyclophilin-like fold protein [Methanothrix sp.]MCQ8903586.1 cyclophilin-like fold protein [Methanothrix sp.]
MRRIEIDIPALGRAIAELDDRNPRTAEAVWNALPIVGKAMLWGEEVYFETPLDCKDENTSPSATAGDISYWSPGNAICIFFGSTQPYSPVNHIGRISEGLGIFSDVIEGAEIVLRRAR